MTTIGAGIVTGCTNLTEIQVEAGNPAYSAVDNILYDKEQTTLIQCLPSKTSVSLPATVTVIGSSAFNNCTGLTSITLPQSLTTIGDRAFWSCTGLTSITIGSSTEQIYGDAFSECTNLKSVSCLAINPPVCMWGSPFDNYDKDLYVPTGSGDKYRNAEVWKEFNITEKTFSGIHSAETKEARIYTRDHNIVIENALPGTPLSVYNPAGVCIESMEISDSETEIALPAQGLYIVKYGDRSIKVVL